MKEKMIEKEKRNEGNMKNQKKNEQKQSVKVC